MTCLFCLLFAKMGKLSLLSSHGLCWAASLCSNRVVFVFAHSLCITYSLLATEISRQLLTVVEVIIWVLP